MSIEIPTDPEALLDMHQVLSMLSISKSKFFKLLKEGKFPKPVKLGSGSRWPKKVVLSFIHSLVEKA